MNKASAGSGPAKAVRPNARRRGLATGLCSAVVLAFLALAMPSRAQAQVLAVLSEGTASYQAVVDELRARLGPAPGPRVDTVTAAQLAARDAPALAGYRLLVPVGMAASQAVAARQLGVAEPVPTLCLLIPRRGFELVRTAWGTAYSDRLSAVYIDQPLSRQLDLIRLALPERRQLGVVLGPTSRSSLEELRQLAGDRDLELNTALADDVQGVATALRALVAASDVMLLLPDAVATSADTVYGLMLTSYRAQVPVVGFSESLLNAGAMVSLYSTVRQQAGQAADIARRVVDHGEPLPPAQSPARFTVGVNASVARSLGLHAASSEALQRALEAVPGDTGEAPAAPTPASAQRRGRR